MEPLMDQFKNIFCKHYNKYFNYNLFKEWKDTSDLDHILKHGIKSWSQITKEDVILVND